MNNAIMAVNLAIQELLSNGEIPTRGRTLAVARQYGKLNCITEHIDRAVEIINFDKLEEFLRDSRMIEEVS